MRLIFNLTLEQHLKACGIKTMHVVSPTIWAWRAKRIHKIARAIDQMLVLLPFEAAIYQQHAMNVKWIGHPLADEIAIPDEIDQMRARTQLQLPHEGAVVALLPGSRALELTLLGPLFLQTASALLRHNPSMRFVIPAVNQQRYQQMQQILAQHGADLPVQLIQGQARTAMSAADVVLLSSGTATLEAMLLQRPMVVAYKMSWLNWQIARRLVKVNFCSLPNLLADEAIVPECIQHAAHVEVLTEHVLRWFNRPAAVVALQQRFAQIHLQLRKGADEQAAQAVISMLNL